MKLSTTTVLTLLSTAQARTQTTATWFSTSTASLLSVSKWRSVSYGPTLVTPIPTNYVRNQPRNATLISIVTEPTASRNINITSWATVQVTPSPGTKTVIVTATVTTFGISTVSMKGTGTSTAYRWSTPATITFRPTVCANSEGALPKTTVTRYTGTYTPFPGQFPTPRSFAKAVTDYYQDISKLHVFPYTGTTDYINGTTTETNWHSTTTITSTSTSLINGLIPAFYTYTTYTTTTTTFWSIATSVHNISIPCPRVIDVSTATATVTHAAQCNPTNIISARGERAVAIILDPKLDTHKWTSRIANTDPKEYRFDAFRDAPLCCQLCVDNAPGGCVASEFDESWMEGCKLWYFVGEKNSSIWDEKCQDRKLEYFSYEDRFAGQENFLQAAAGDGACGGLRYIGGYDCSALTELEMNCRG
ncbi:hypothetical protein V8F06_011068 [Rhypophila decipiens]